MATYITAASTHRRPSVSRPMSAKAKSVSSAISESDGGDDERHCNERDDVGHMGEASEPSPLKPPIYCAFIHLLCSHHIAASRTSPIAAVVVLVLLRAPTSTLSIYTQRSVPSVYTQCPCNEPSVDLFGS